jgi:chromosome segregation ATPase
MAIGVPRPI